MGSISARVISVHIGAGDTLEKIPCDEIEFALDGIINDRHRGPSRECYEGDKQAQGTVRRNERQWSAISTEEIELIEKNMDLAEPLLAASLGVNLCLTGVPELSNLPRGTLLTFASGAILMVEEYNPPCSDMGEKLASMHTTRSGEPLTIGSFSSAAKFSRGVVGVVEVGGQVAAGDAVIIESEQLPKWLRSEG